MQDGLLLLRVNAEEMLLEGGELQYQPKAWECDQAPHGVPYFALI